ncbi:MAG: hypothetical protein KQJ78_11440 [Deltaproteobacteria bacterium]|nr:hypothetical protein [Deltaproteobacteria bacterium]
MKKLVACLLGWAVLAAVIAVPPARADQAADRAAIQTVLKRAAAAFGRRDLDAITRNFEPDAVLVLQGGQRISLQEARIMTAGFLLTAQNLATRLTLGQTTIKGDRAQVDYVEIHEFDLLTDLGHRYRTVSQIDATFRHSRAGWRVAAAQVTGHLIYRDGVRIADPWARQAAPSSARSAAPGKAPAAK